jgi:Flagellar transcriptional activator (FlhC)
MSRALDCETAHEVLVAEALARLGAAATLIERLTGFGSRWSRILVRRSGGPLAYKPRDARFYEGNTDRRHHAWLAVVTYMSQSANLSAGARFVEAYIVYRGEAEQPGLLSINEFAQVIELYRTRNAQLRTCSDCAGGHLVFTEKPICPLCQLVLRAFCRSCGGQLEDNARHTTLYCASCSASHARVAERRRARRRKLAGGGGISLRIASSQKMVATLR